MKKVSEKKVLILSFIGVIALILVVVGATYAYFQATSSGDGTINTNISSNTTDNLSFNIGNAISISATEENFGEGMPSLSGSTQASAILTANNYTNNATRNYYVYLNIDANEFIYTTDTNETELFLTITDSNGDYVTSIDGLTPVTIDGVQGFDITTKTGLITIANNYEITTTNTTTQEWNITVTFINLDSDQQGNTEKSFSAKLIMQEDAPIRINEVTTSNITTNSITLNVDAESDNTISNYYYQVNDEEVIESSSNTYTFSNLDAGVEYNFKVYVKDDQGYQSATYSINETTEDLVLFADYIKTQVYTGDGNNGLYYHDGSGSYTNAAEEAGDNSYRYAGANPNNYVCFGSDADTCPDDNLYRIIGVFGSQVKLIKNSSIGNYYWSGSSSNSSNQWGDSTLNTGTLNGTYLNGLGTTWNDMIETTTWKVGGNVYAYIATNTSKVSAYIREIVSPAANTTYNAKIGLMYVSDYYYAASPTYWSYAGYSDRGASYDYRAATGSNWMYSGVTEWTITRDSYITYNVFFVADTGYVNFDFRNRFGIRPSFYLKSNVAITSGDGSSANPFRIELS